jgi:hypothetical protein
MERNPDARLSASAFELCWNHLRIIEDENISPPE